MQTYQRPKTSSGRVQGNTVDMKHMCQKNTDVSFWQESFTREEMNYRSFATLAERRLLEAEMKTVGLEVPNMFRTAVACDILHKMSDAFARCYIPSVLRSVRPSFFTS
jgi:hypothetical protein